MAEMAVRAILVIALVGTIHGRLLRGEGDREGDVVELESPHRFRHEGYGSGYMPSFDLMTCVCAKCGSTAIFEFIYELTFDNPWPEHDGRPWVQDLSSLPWGGEFLPPQSRSATTTKSIAVVRDPKERLISAWKSKFSCDEEGYLVDGNDREWLVPELLRNVDRALLQDPTGANNTCLSLEDFVTAVQDVHNKGHAADMESHIKPQNLGCFAEVPADRWNEILDIADPDVFRKVAMHFRGNHARKVRVHSHTTGSGGSGEGLPEMSPKTVALLNNITRVEYEMLSPYLVSTNHISAA